MQCHWQLFQKIVNVSEACTSLTLCGLSQMLDHDQELYCFFAYSSLVCPNITTLPTELAFGSDILRNRHQDTTGSVFAKISTLSCNLCHQCQGLVDHCMHWIKKHWFRWHEITPLNILNSYFSELTHSYDVV